MLTARFELGDEQLGVDDAVTDLISRHAVERIWSSDHTLFQDDPTECANRFGWLETTHDSLAAWSELSAAAAALATETDHVVLMGMGGSSLFPEVLAKTFGSAPGFPELHVIDTTHPDAVERVTLSCSPERTFYIAASKSGSTVETRSQLAHFWQRHPDGSRFGVITDPGSALGDLARSRSFAHVWENDPDIGGRFSALSLFGMVPAALIGVDGPRLLDSAGDAADGMAPGDDEHNAGLRLGAVMGALALRGRDKMVVRLDPRLGAMGVWLEQLVAESLGKHGGGVVPIVEEPNSVVPDGSDRWSVTIGEVPGAWDRARSAGSIPRGGEPEVRLAIDDEYDLGGQVLAWEFATTVAGAVMGVNPFDQPDVESAKVAAREALASGTPPAPAPSSLEDLVASLSPGDHLAVTAFVDPDSAVVDQLRSATSRIAERHGAVSTFGVGPRFLHSTGQLHKGGPDSIVVVQVIDTPEAEVDIPDEPFSFGQLISAQAAGDLLALAGSGKRHGRVSAEDLIDAAR